MTIDKPSDAKGLAGYRMTAPMPDVVALLVDHACATLALVGQMTDRVTEAEGLIGVVRAEFGG